MNSGEESGKRGTMMRRFFGKAWQKGELPAGAPRGRRLAVLALSALMLSVCGCGSVEEPLIGREADPDMQPGLVQAGAAAEDGQAGEALTTGESGQGAQSKENVSSAGTELLYVYVCGAVKEPGVVALAPGSRVEDALKAAGGFAQEADKNGVNLADWVTDGEKLYFPAEGETLMPEAAGETRAAGFVNINSADVQELCTLPGIGEVRAADIISYREQNGGFESTEDIMQVPGIKSGAYEKIKDRITVK